jgi:threonine/homoserine/homoserine lactone efflux protein
VVAFLGLCVLLLLTPGPNQALLTSRTLAGGVRDGLATVAGLAGGLAVHVAAALVGLSALLAASADALAAVRLAGGAYLVLLGVLAWRGARREAPAPVRAHAGGARRAVRDGLASMALNPKATVFFVAVVPQFVAPGPGASLRVAALLLLYGALAAAFWVAWVLAVHRAQAVVRRPAVRTWTQRLTGGALVALGLRLAVPGR